MHEFNHFPISSVTNPRVKSVAALQRKRGRSGTLIVIEGTREVARALDSGINPVEAYYCPAIAETSFLRDLLARLEESGAAICNVTQRVYEKLAYRKSTEGIVIVAERPLSGLGQLDQVENPLYIVADSIEKPGNLGAIFRSADGAGVSGIIVTGAGTDIFNPNTVRASLGTVFSIPSAEGSPREVIEYLEEKKITIIKASPAADLLYWEMDLAVPCAFVLGAEDTGISEEWQEASGTSVRIPMSGTADSLNVSASAAILTYEALRQRAAKQGKKLP